MKLSRIAFGVALPGIVFGRLTAGAEPIKPAWLTDCSVGVKEGYDDNVFQSGVKAKDLPATYAVPPGSVAALKNEYSWITTISPKIGVNFSPMFGTQTNLPLVSLAYAPDFVVYHDQTSESYDAHRVLAAVKVKTEPVAVSGENNFVYIDGNDMGPVYPGGFYSAFATAAARERREQIQERANISAQFDQAEWFFRPTAALLYYDLMTGQLNLSGYQNYCDRYDVNGGADFGYKLKPDLALTLGYRYGHQYQQQYSFSPYSASSDYQRVLAGIEGNPWHWLNVKMASGPDFRCYQGDSAGHITPVNDVNAMKYYGEALITATFAPENTLIFKYKVWEWVSGSGKVPYCDGSYELAYHGKLTKKLGFDVGGKFTSYDFNSGNLPTCKRHDLLYTASSGVNYAVSSHVSVGVNGILNWGRNGQDDVANSGTREFNQQMVSVGTQLKF
jgi:hypothetical protein